MELWNRNKKIGFIMFLALLPIACDQGQLSQTTNIEISLAVGDTVQVSTGDQLLPLSEKTVIDVTHVLEDGTKTVTILSGTARLIRRDHVLVN